MAGLIAFWSHALAAVTFAAVLMWRTGVGSRQPGHRLLLAAFAVTACWAWLAAVVPGDPLVGYAESARNLVWIGLLYSLSAASDERQRALREYRVPYLQEIVFLSHEDARVHLDASASHHIYTRDRVTKDGESRGIITALTRGDWDRVDPRRPPIDAPLAKAISRAMEEAGIRPLAIVVREFEREYIERALAAADGKKARAADMLGISRKNLWEKCKALGIED